MENKVVITGSGVISPYGVGHEVLVDGLLNNKNVMKTIEILKEFPFVNSHIASTVPEIDFKFIPRMYRRSMTKMSLYAVMACMNALKMAKYEKAPEGTALFVGSTVSSMDAWLGFCQKYFEKQLNQVKTTSVFQVLTNSPLANIAQALDISGQGYFISNACASSLTNIGLAYQLIKAGFIKSALCGGTEEYHPMFTGCFSILAAASGNFNDQPQKASRPFDKDRCGIVCSEGCGMLYIESEESALKRGANIIAEIKGFATNTQTQSIAHPSKESMAQCMKLALESANMQPKEVDLVNAHATSTIAGDMEEVNAISQVYGRDIKVNSLKGHFGHSMAASGAIELIAIINMMLQKEIAGTMNLDNVDPQCDVVSHIRQSQKLNFNTFAKNSFALGGTNASIIIRRYN